MTNEPLAKLQFGSKTALASPDSTFRKVPMPSLDMSLCEKIEPALQSSNLDREASLAKGSTENPAFCGILPVSKAEKSTSFHLVSLLRRRTNIEKIGHAGTLDPFATGVMVMLIGRMYTRASNQFLDADKEYQAIVRLGQTTDTYDIDGQILSKSPHIPALSDLEKALLTFQGECQQIPPMFSAKKVGGKKLYDLARKGTVIERAPVTVRLHTTLIHYTYPDVQIHVRCSKGTYIRALAHDLGQMLGCGAFLYQLCRTRSGTFSLSDCMPQEKILDAAFDLRPFLRRSL